MKSKILIMTALLCLAGLTFACYDNDTTEPNTNNSHKHEVLLSDLLWLKDRIDEITLDLHSGPRFKIAIYQCMYSYGKSKIGFLEDRGNVRFFYDYDGNVLCVGGGFMGDTCLEELKIDLVNKELIWSDEDV